MPESDPDNRGSAVAALEEISAEMLPPAGTAPDGLSPADSLNFSFSYYGIHFEATATPTEDGTVLEYEGRLGPMLFSLEHAERRQSTLDVIRACRLFGVIDLSVSADHQVVLRDRRTLPGPATAKTLIAGIAASLIDAKPSLDLLAGLLATEPAG